MRHREGLGPEMPDRISRSRREPSATARAIQYHARRSPHSRSGSRGGHLGAVPPGRVVPLAQRSVGAVFSSESDGDCVDELDLDILRWMYPGGVWSPWGVGPKISAIEIASHVGLDRSAVWARIRRWSREGFWEGFEVQVNFAIFDVELLHASIEVADSAKGCALIDRLASVEGVVAASLHVGDSPTARDVQTVAVLMVNDGRTQVERRMRTLRRLSPTTSVTGPFRMAPPRSSRPLTPLDWRIIATIFDNPNLSPSKAARRVGVTLKTFDRHHSALVEDRVVSYAPKVDWSRMGCVALGFYCDGAQVVEGVRRAVAARFPHSMPIAVEGLGPIAPGFDPSRCFGVIVPAHSPHEVLTLVRDLSRLAGVREVRPELWGPQRSFPGWVVRRISEHLGVPADVQPLPIPSPG
jgi:DNA-binding Lrp family transcriptional regulator